MATKGTKSDNRWIKALSIILSISLAFNLILFMKRTEFFPAKKELIERIDKLSSQISIYKNEIKSYKGISKEIDDVVEDANRKLEKKEQEILAIKNEKKLKEKEIQGLLLQLDSLQIQHLGMIDSLLVEREQQKVINQKIEGLEAVINDLNSKLGIAGMLLCDNLEVTPLKQNKRGKRQPTAMVQRAYKFELCFDILENRLTKPGLQQIYFVITSPNAEVLFDQDAGKPVFFHPDYKSQAQCSKIEEINFQNKKIHFCSTIRPEQISNTGLYLVEIFSSNQKLGMTSFTLR